MQAERWRQIDEIFHAALDIEERRRAAFLDRTCSGDETLRRELERLLALHEDAGSFLESPAVEVAAEAFAITEGPCQDSYAVEMLGRTISHYRILSRLGSGGMGEVYEAEDIRLGRRVALKFLSADLSRDPRALERFEREARAASSLNHANICTVYEVEEYNHQPVIVMELLDGESLRDRIRGGPLSSAVILEIGTQVSEALEAAHAKGIIHRDLKPANIFVVVGGRVKILDFGLAKVMSSPKVEDKSEDSLTLDGAVPGTTSYLSPEQARGEKIDQRSDLFSLGVVLYEMATARNPFARKNPVLTIDAILNASPPAAASLNPQLPAELDRMIARMLEKDRDRRYAHASDVRSDLTRLQAAMEPAESSPRRRAGTRVQARTLKYIWAACAAVLALAAGAFFALHRGHPLNERNTIVLADFENKTGDAVFDDTLRQAMEAQIQESPFLSLTSEERLQQALHLMNKAADARLTPQLAREVCVRTESAAVLEGSIARLGNEYVVWLRARNCGSGDVLFEQQAQAARKEDVLKSLTGITAKFRSIAGEPVASVEKYSIAATEVTTPSLEAWRAYGQARRVHLTIGGTAALPLFQRALALDPDFAMAYASLGMLYGETGESDLSAENITKAWQLRERASDAERFFITASYQLRVLGNAEKLQQTCEAWAQAYPRERDAHGLLANGVLAVAGKYQEALQEANRAIERDPNFALGYVLVADQCIALGRLGDAEKAIQGATARRLEIPVSLVTRYNIAFLRGDRVSMEQQIRVSRQKPEIEGELDYQESFALTYTGHLQDARSKSRRAVDLARQTGHRERASLYEAGAAIREAFLGNASEASRSARAALELSADRESRYGVALALALVGDSPRAESLADDLERGFPEDTSVNFSYLPVLRARLALNHGEPAKAIELLQTAAPNELGRPRSAFHGSFGAMYPVYTRGEALLAEHLGADAAREFQNIINHRGIVISDPVGALARLELGRAYVMAGDKTKAKAAYEDFLTVWKAADADIPILKEAKAEYARLQ